MVGKRTKSLGDNCIGEYCHTWRHSNDPSVQRRRRRRSSNNSPPPPTDFDVAAAAAAAQHHKEPAPPPPLKMKGTPAVLATAFLAGVLIAVLFSGLLSARAPAGGQGGRQGEAKVHSLPDAGYMRIVDDSHHLLFPSPGDVIRRPSDEVSSAPGGGDTTATEEDDDDGNMAAALEAVNSLNAALEFKKAMKLKKAGRLFQHALSLAPRHPAVLNSYGEFLVESQNDLVKADHMFVRAITFSSVDSEDYHRGLANRRRTAVLVEEIDKGTLERIDGKKLAFQKIHDNSAALKRAKKEAYFQYIYHTVGIEGNTMSLAQTRSILETKMAVAGKSIMEHNEILGLDAALKYINQTLVDKLGEITLSDILELHRRVIGHVDPLEAGLFRRTQVYVGDHVPPPASLVELLVGKFVEWLNGYPASSLHPVRLAALVHYKLVYIHPFVDGNGRTSRLLMNLVLMKAGFPPVIIRRADRDAYYRYLTIANEGDVRPFIRFIARCTERTLDAYLYATQEYDVKPEQLDYSTDLPSNIVEHPLEVLHHDMLDQRSRTEEDDAEDADEDGDYRPIFPMWDSDLKIVVPPFPNMSDTFLQPES